MRWDGEVIVFGFVDLGLCEVELGDSWGLNVRMVFTRGWVLMELGIGLGGIYVEFEKL